MDEDRENDQIAKSESTLVQKANPEAHKTPKADQTPVLRSNFNETAFFFPQLKTRDDGSVQFSFQLPDALTRWRLMLLAHTRDLKTGNAEYTFTASKDLMIMSNLPRFFREGDTIILQAKVVNTAGKKISGTAKLSFIADGSESDSYNYLLDKQIISFESIETAQSTTVSWKLIVPTVSEPLILRFSATSGEFTDSEQHMIPVLPRKTWVTESLVLNTSANSNKTFRFKPFDPKFNYSTERLEIQLCSNPSWYAIQALPYLEEEMYNNAESIFNRFYANTLASIVAAQIPDAMEVIRQWKEKNPEELQSELSKNEHLKSVLLQETPWVMEAKAESEQKQRISLLFDINRMQYETENSLQKLLEQQSVNGAWSWFPGMPESEYITNRIVTGIGKLNKLSGGIAEKPEFTQMTLSAITFLDQEMLKDYSLLKKEGKLAKYSLGSDHLNYLYMRSFFVDKSMNEAVTEGFNFMLNHLQTDWKSFGKGQQAMASVTLHRFGKEKAAKAILASLLEHAIENPDLGMYWKYAASYYWYTAPVESQSLIINAFDEIGGYTKEVDQMRTWLLSQKQTRRWENSSATAEAVYALLIRGNDWIHHSKAVQLKVGNEIIATGKTSGQTPMFTKVWEKEKISSKMQDIEISNPNPSMSWGSAFRQYFADIDRVQSSNGQVSITKELFIKQTGPNGVEIVPVKKQGIKVGDKVIVRLILTVDRDMEYVHLKDQRAAAFEPIDVISSYHYEGGLGYYQSTRDASTDFFFDH
ncbi:MAG: alpha-2-macroglobulin family protein, partial [Bacteroidales bacterium]